MAAGDPWVLMQHVAFEGPGSVAAAVRASGAELAVVRIDRAEPVPAPAAVRDMAGLVVMGGPMGVHDAFDWLEPERALLRAAVEAGLPVLGVCLGAQQLACALGGDVVTGAAPELGVGEVHLTAAAIQDPVFGPAPTPLPCVHWHGDTFTLPEAAVRLAGNDAYENQAFRVGCPGLRPAIPRRGHREPRRALGLAPPRRRLRTYVGRRARRPRWRRHRAAHHRAGGGRVMGVRPGTVRRIALEFPESVEAPHHDMTSFRVGGKIFATMPPAGGHLHVFLDADEVAASCAEFPDAVQELWWGTRLSGCRVQLRLANIGLVRELLSESWRRRAPARLREDSGA